MTNIAILIVGMHRSGTSALTRVLNLLGADLGPSLLGPMPSNETGHWESLKILEAHEEILKSLDTSWDDIKELPDGWVERVRYSIPVKKIQSFLKEHFKNSKIWAVKDPRLCRLLPLWKELMDEIGCDPLYISIIRHPLEVALSLQRRDGTPISIAGQLWFNSVIGAEERTRGRRRAFLTYENLLNDWRQAIKSIELQTEFTFPPISAETMNKIDAFLEPSLRHHTASKQSDSFGNDLPNYAIAAYSILEKGINRQDYDFAKPLESVKKEYISESKSYTCIQLFNLYKDFAKLQKPIESNFVIHGLSQLFVDTGAGFNEPESVTISDTIQKSLLVFSLKNFAAIKALRFDPLDGPCVIEIQDAKLIAENGSTVPLNIQTSNAMHKEDNKFFFSTDDPIILMDFDFQSQALSAVEIKLNYFAVGYRALQDCVVMQEKFASDLSCQNELMSLAVGDRDAQIASLNQAVGDRDAQIASLDQAVADRDAQMVGLFHSRSWRLTAPLRYAKRQYKRLTRLEAP